MFKVGDTVKRINGRWGSIKEGDVAVVSQVDHNNIKLVGHSEQFMSAAFELVPPAGRKDDSGKLDMTLLDDMPRAIEAVVEVMQWAITKKAPVPYVRGSWLGVHPDRYRAAIKRHDSAAAKQASNSAFPAGTEFYDARFQTDDETKLLHLAHVACSAMFALESTLREIESTKA